MASAVYQTFAMFASVVMLGSADEIAWGDVNEDGSLDMRSLDVPVAMAHGADNFFIANPMDSHDWSHTSVVRNSLHAEQKTPKATSKVAGFEEALRPIFSVLPKDSVGRLNNGTARYALHRFFSEKYGWSIKGLQPAGAAWVATMSVTPDVKDVTKYMVPTYIQDLLLGQLGHEGFDLHYLAVVAATIKHLMHSEMLSVIYAVYTTLELPVPGRKNQQEVDSILETFMMVYAFGLNLDVSVMEDVQIAKAHLETSHSGWPQLLALAKDAKWEITQNKDLDFQELVLVAEKLGERYAQWQGQDCRRVKDELAAKPSYRDGRVHLSEVQPSHVTGRRSLFTETADNLEKLGVLSKVAGAETQLIIPNYVNSQSMCLSTASFYTACCVNECEGLLAKLESQIGTPTVSPTELAGLMALLPGSGIADSLMQEIPTLADQSSGLVPLHGKGLAGWMHRAFPLECPLSVAAHDQKVTNPKTPDEWIGESDLQVQELEDMMGEIAKVLAQYTTMGKKAGNNLSAPDRISDPTVDIFRIIPPERVNQLQPQRNFLGTLFRIAAMLSMLGVVSVAAKTSIAASGRSQGKVGKVAMYKDFV